MDNLKKTDIAKKNNERAKNSFAKFILWFSTNYFLYSIFQPKTCSGVECEVGLVVYWDTIFSLVVINALAWSIYVLFIKKYE